MKNLMLAWLIAAAFGFQAPPEPPQTLWLEAETFGPLRGGNFSFQPVEQTTRGTWSVAGPDTAPSWTQGGESEWMSVAARADEPGELVIGRGVEIPAAGTYTLWVRYADYRSKQEAFGVRVRQGGKTQSFTFGLKPVVDALDPLLLLWDWAFAWDHVTLPLEKGTAHVELFTTGPTEARRAVDCLCLTTDAAYQPTGREKPDHPTWRRLRERPRGGEGKPEGKRRQEDVPKAWKIAEGPPTFLWNVGAQWSDELKKPPEKRVESPFTVDPPLLKDFVAAFEGKAPPIYSHPLSGPILHVPAYPKDLAAGSPFLDWLGRHPQAKFGILLNYGEPTWPPGADRGAIRANLKRFGNRFVGYVAGENIAYANVDNTALEAKVRTAKTRGDILVALREVHTAATRAKFTDYYGAPLTDAEAWADVISCLSAGNEAFTHALCAWGVKRIGHENTGNSPTLARRLAFLRGAARQFGVKIADYQSCNLGDSATMFSREHYFYPASSRYILDNSYDAWAGAGTNWLLKDYVLWHLAGVDVFYNEQGIDLFWKPGGGAAGDGFPVQLSPKGKVAEAAMQLAQAHPRGTQVTPVAFLVDEAHGWSQERFQPGGFGLDPLLNPALLQPGRHEASLRGWFDVAYFPAPETQNEPATAVRQTYVNGIFGDIFDVIVTAPKRTEIAFTYPVLIAAGEVSLSAEWGKALQDYERRGGTLVVCADQLSGPGVAVLGLPTFGPAKEASAFTWTATGEKVPSNTFRYASLPAGKDRVLATAPDGTSIAIARSEGKGELIVVGVPLGLGLDERPIPLLALLMRRLTDGLLPVTVTGDVEWTLNRLDDGGWLVGLLNNRGVGKPQHGILPTDHRAAQAVTLRVPFAVASSAEWMTETPLTWQPSPTGATLTVTVPAGAVRLIAITPKR